MGAKFQVQTNSSRIAILLAALMEFARLSVDVLGMAKRAGGTDKLPPSLKLAYDATENDAAALAAFLVMTHDADTCSQFARIARQLVDEAQVEFLQTVPPEARGKVVEVLDSIGVPTEVRGGGVLEDILQVLAQMGVKAQVIKVDPAQPKGKDELKAAEDNALKDILGDIFELDGEDDKPKGPRRPADN
jgi:hypothetical protein